MKHNCGRLIGSSVLTCLFLAGCSATPARPKDACLVFGKVTVSNKLPASVPLLVDQKAVITFAPTNTGTRATEVELKGNGGPFFLWLVPGDYAALELRTSSKASWIDMSSWSIHRIWAQFTVPPKTPILYVGELHMEIGSDGGSSWSRSTVSDTMDSSIEDLKNAYPKYANIPVAKQIMRKAVER